MKKKFEEILRALEKRPCYPAPSQTNNAALSMEIGVIAHIKNHGGKYLVLATTPGLDRTPRLPTHPLPSNLRKDFSDEILINYSVDLLIKVFSEHLYTEAYWTQPGRESYFPEYKSLAITLQNQFSTELLESKYQLSSQISQLRTEGDSVVKVITNILQHAAALNKPDLVADIKLFLLKQECVKPDEPGTRHELIKSRLDTKFEALSWGMENRNKDREIVAKCIKLDLEFLENLLDFRSGDGDSPTTESYQFIPARNFFEHEDGRELDIRVTYHGVMLMESWPKSLIGDVNEEYNHIYKYLTEKFHAISQLIVGNILHERRSASTRCLRNTGLNRGFFSSREAKDITLDDVLGHVRHKPYGKTAKILQIAPADCMHVTTACLTARVFEFIGSFPEEATPRGVALRLSDAIAPEEKPAPGLTK